MRRGRVKPAPFEYHAPTTVDEVVGLLRELGDEAKVLAGGQSLIPMLNLRLARFAALIDIGRVASLRRIESANGHVAVGALVRQSTVEASGVIGRDVPLLAAATPLIGHFQIRNRGTVGGSIAHADPAAEYPAVALALDAEMDVVGPGGARTVPAADVLRRHLGDGAGDGRDARRGALPGLGRGLRVRRGGGGPPARRLRHRRCACGVRVGDGRIGRAAIALFGVGSTPVRAEAAERALVGADSAAVDAARIGRLAADGLHPPDDLHASGALAAAHRGRSRPRAPSGRAIEEASRG